MDNQPEHFEAKPSNDPSEDLMENIPSGTRFNRVGSCFLVFLILLFSLLGIIAAYFILESDRVIEMPGPLLMGIGLLAGVIIGGLVGLLIGKILTEIINR
jgi:hypothetical protein